MEVRRKSVNLALKMVSSRNIVDVVTFLKKQLSRSVEQEDKVRISPPRGTFSNEWMNV